MRSTHLIIVLLFFSGIAGRCQPAVGSLDVPRLTDTTPVATLLSRVDRLPADSGKMNLLLGLSYYYWRLGKGVNLDHCLSFAEQAYALGLAIHNVSGPPEAVFMQAKVYAERNEMSVASRLLPLVYGEQRARLTTSATLAAGATGTAGAPNGAAGAGFGEPKGDAAVKYQSCQARATAAKVGIGDNSDYRRDRDTPLVLGIGCSSKRR